MKKILPVKILFLVIMWTAVQYGQGTLKGVITDSLTKDLLVGANVFLPGTSLGDATNLEGEFIIKVIPAGTYTVRITYIGYKAKELTVQITSGKTEQIDVKIVPDVIEGEEVLITSQAAGQIAAINQQKSSNTIINVVSEEKIKELPDANAAEAIGRLPGVSIIRSGGEANKIILRGLEDKFTNITIDGIKIPPTDAVSRGVDLSMISQSTLAGIELYKALTPDKDADALAGSVNLVTKLAPETRKIRADLKGNYNNLTKSLRQYDFALNYGERFFDNFLGVQVNGNLERKNRSNERINVEYNNYLPTDYMGYYIDNFLLEYTDEIRERNGASMLLDFKTPDDGTIRINNVYARTNRNYFWSTRDYPGLNGGRNNEGKPSFDYRSIDQSIDTYNSSLRGDNKLFGLSINWGLSFAESKSKTPFDYEMIFAESNGMNPAGQLKYNPEQLIKFAVNDFSNAPLNWAYNRGQNNYDKERTAFLDISKEYLLGDLFSGVVKAGGKYKVKDRTNQRTEAFTPYYLSVWKSYERLPDGTIRPKDFTGTYFGDWQKLNLLNITLDNFYTAKEDRNIYGSYLLNPLIDEDRLRKWQELNKNGIDATGNVSEVWDNPLIAYDDYIVTERVSAAYLMNTFNFGQDITLIAGLRLEAEDNNYISKYMTKAISGFPVPSVMRDTASSSNQTVLLPNINLAYRPFDFFTLRLAVYKALARPDFNMRLDRYIAGKPAEMGTQQQIFVGNPALKTAQAWNYEINTSFYGNEIGLISLSAYYKEIKDMYHMLTNFNTSGDTLMQRFGIEWKNSFPAGAAYNLTLPYNSPQPAKVWGFEFDHQINFHFLPGLLKNIILSYNASFVRSEMTIYESRIVTYIDSSGRFPVKKSRNILAENKHKLEGMPEFFGNVSLGYDIGDFSARISMFHKASYDSSYTSNGIQDPVTLEFTRFDVSLKQRITKNLSFFINLNNINNTGDGESFFNRGVQRTLFDRSEKYGMTGDFGVTLEL